MVSADLSISRCRQFVPCQGEQLKRKAAFQDVDLIILPGFVDPHNYLPFTGNREREFRLRIKGAIYQILATQGIGLQAAVNVTRSVSHKDIVSLCLERLDRMLRWGTTPVETKSGYGLNLDDEIKQLEAIKAADSLHPIDLAYTFLGSHEVSKNYNAGKNDYNDLLTHEILPKVKKKDLAGFFDIFGKERVYYIAESRSLIAAAQQAGLRIKIHADAFTPMGGAQPAVESRAISTEHLVAISDDGIRRMAESDTAAILLPGVPFFLMQEHGSPGA